MDRKESGQQAVENLEDMLIYDDMFLDYFNAFLSLPAFPQVLQYHRLTGTFRIVDSPDDSLVEWTNSSEPLYGATDDERETIMTWAQAERLPLFTKTELYREYKLCKLLLRPVDARKTGARPDTYVRGYSRTSGSMGSLTDTEADDGSSDDDDDEEFDDSQDEEGDEDEEDEDGEFNTTGNDVSDLTSSSGLSNRPPTHARSLPDRLAGPGGSSGARRRRRRRPRDIDLDESTTTGAVDASSSGLVIDASTATPSRIQQHRRLKASQQTVGGDGRTYSAPHNYQEFAMLPMSTDFDLLRDLQEAPAVVSFSTRGGETGGVGTTGGPGDSLDLKGLEARQNLPFDRLKELMLSNRQGVQEFFEFLRPTAGLHLVDFWLDCEFYKDTASERSDADNRQTRGRLLRDLQDKYRLRLTEEAKAQMRNAANDPQQANSILLRTQYDVLRRLRSYWLPRYIIHKERELSGQTFSDLQQAWLSNATRRASAVSTIFPSLSLVNSMPVRPDLAHNLAITEGWDQVRAGGRRLDDRIRSAKGWPQLQQSAVPAKPVSASRPFQARLRDALTVDRIAGGPFRSYLEFRHRDAELLACLMFFQEVEEYSRRDERTSDRFLRLGHAWNIFNRYLNVSASHPVKVDKRECQTILDVLRRSKDTVPARVFAKAQDSVVARMGDTWLRFLKEDVKNFLESSVSHRDSDSPPRTSDEIQVYIENGKIIVKRLQPERSQVQSQPQRRRSWDFLTDDEKAERRKAAAEKRRITELERKKALKAARKRLREMEEAGRKKKNLVPLEEENETQEVTPETTFDSQQDSNKQLGSKQWTGSTDTEDYMFNKPQNSDDNLQSAKQDSQQSEDPFAASSYSQSQFLDFEDAIATAATARKSVQFDLPRQPAARSREPTDLEGIDVKSPTGRVFAEMVQKQRLSRALLRFDFARDYEGRASSKKIEEEEEPEKAPELKEMVKNRAVMALFKKYASDKEGRDSVNALSLYQETMEFLELPPGVGDKAKKKRDGNALYLYKTYLEKGCKRRVEVTNERLQQRLTVDKDRPKTPTMKDLANHLHAKLNLLFANFWQFQSEEMGIDMSALKNMSEKELRMRADLNVGAGARRGKKATGKAPPTKEDKVEFLVALEKNLSGPLSLQMLYFYRYLMQYSVQDKVPHLDKNLFFYVEAQKYKEFVQGGCDEEFLKRKIQVISSIFLESVFPPPLQITISNDLHQRTLRNAQKYSNPKHKEEMSATIFDEAQFAVFKEMLPYWAGFMKQWTPAGKEYRPVSNQKRMLEERLQKFENSGKPNVNFKLPELPAHSGGPISSLTLSLMEGIKWKDDDDRRGRRNDMRTTMIKQQN